jgi:hypothetical protein
MQTIKAEPKPEMAETLLLQGESAPSMSPEIEKAIGQAINGMLDPSLANMHSEITEREKILLQALYVKSIGYYKQGELNNYPRLYQTDRLLKGVSVGRQRATEMVEILKEVQMYKSQKGLLSRIKSGLFG